MSLQKSNKAYVDFRIAEQVSHFEWLLEVVRPMLCYLYQGILDNAFSSYNDHEAGIHWVD